MASSQSNPFSITVTPGAVFPLAVSSNGRYLQDAQGRPFFVHGDTPWSLEVQCTHEQILTYLDDRQSKGFNAILFETMEHLFSSQTPAYRNAQSAADPFTTMTDFSAPNETYWQTIDFIVNEALARGIACFITHSYLGYGGGSEGWNVELEAESDADLQAYGVFLAQRFTQGNVVWVAGGDYNPPSPGKQWLIHDGIRSVRTTDLMTGHGSRHTEAYSIWNGRTGFNLNCIYCGTDGVSYDDGATAYGRPGPVPFFLIEGGYDGSYGADVCRRQVYQAVLSGACGHFFGNTPLWGFGEPNFNGGAGAAAALATSLSTAATLQMGHARALLLAYPWWTLTPRTDGSLVSTPLGSGTSRICPALAADGSFALIWTGGASFTCDLTSLAPSLVRARWFDPVTGTYATVSGSPFANNAPLALTAPGERVLVLDAA